MRAFLRRLDRTNLHARDDRHSMHIARNLIFNSCQRPAQGMPHTRQLVDRAHLRAMRSKDKKGLEKAKQFRLFKTPLTFDCGTQSVVGPYFDIDYVKKVIKKHLAIDHVSKLLHVNCSLPLRTVKEAADGVFYLVFDSVQKIDTIQEDGGRICSLVFDRLSELFSASELTKPEQKVFVQRLQQQEEIVAQTLLALSIMAMLGIGGSLKNLTLVKNEETPTKISIINPMRAESKIKEQNRGAILFERTNYGPSKVTASIFKKIDEKTKRISSPTAIIVAKQLAKLGVCKKRFVRVCNLIASF